MKVELLNHFGDDLMVVNAARVSFGKSKKEFDGRDAKLIKYLIDHKHTSPFRHPQLQFRIECSIVVERQLFKHQIGLTANSISGRYVDFSDSYDPPSKFRLQSSDSKQGSAGFVDEDLNMELQSYTQDVINYCQEIYQIMCDHGIAKEQARMILPLCLNTQFIWTGSLAAYLHLWSLRLKPDAQQETREVADLMLQEVKNIEGGPFKHTIEAFNL